MEISITVNDSDPEIRAILNGIYSTLAIQGKLKIKKLSETEQEWSLTRDGVTRSLRCRINFVNTVNSITNKTIVNDKREESELEKAKPKSFIHQPKSRAINFQVGLFEATKPVRREEVQAFIDFWNGNFWLPQIRGTDRQCQAIKIALIRPLFANHYKEGVSEIAKSKFLRGANEKKFKLTLDWFLVNDNFDKIIEGKYRDNEKDTKTVATSDRFTKDTID